MSDTKIDRIENKIDRVSERLSSIDSTLSAQHVSLVEHIKRTEMLEAQVEPIKSSVAMAEGALKFLALLALLVGTAAGAIKVIEFTLGK